MRVTDQIDVFYGRVTHSSAQIYVRVSSLAGGGEWSIAGQVRGPIARGVRTLPTTVALTDLGRGATLLASCSIPDPAFWTTQLPGAYELNIQLVHEGRIVETVTRTFGIRFFGASGRNFLWEGKRWVMRGVSTLVAEVEEIDVFQDNAGVIVVQDPSDALLDRASNSGVMLVVELTGGDLLRELRRLSRWPAVAMVVLPSDCSRIDELRAAASNLLFAQRLVPDQAIAEWAQVSFCDTANLSGFEAVAKQSSLPIIAERRLNGDFTLAEARRECDHLQRDLAPLGDFAGYVVHCSVTSNGKIMGAE